jgi:AcrR family transcriptional regulator
LVTGNTAEKTTALTRQAAALFRRRGFHGTSMGDLGAAMNLNKGSLYHYFPSKGDILFAIYREVLVTLDANIARVDATLRADEKLVAYIRAITQTRAAVPDFVAVYFQEHPWLEESLSAEQCATVRGKESEWMATVRGVFEEGIRDGIFRRINAEMMAIQLVSTFSSLYQWHLGEDEMSANLVVDTILSYLFEGILRSPEAFTRFEG